MATLATNSVVNLQFQYFNQNGTLIGPLPYRNSKLPYSIVISMDLVDSQTAAKLNSVGPIPPNPPTAWQTITNSTLRSFSTTVYLSNATP